MKLENSFTVPVPVEQAWQVLQDVERIAPCMPGATLDTVDGDAFTGRVKVKVGPIMLTYSGKATFADKDEVDLSRRGDELVVTVASRRRLMTLPSALRRCDVTGARFVDERLLVDFVPDPALWMTSHDS